MEEHDEQVVHLYFLFNENECKIKLIITTLIHYILHKIINSM